MKLILLFIVIGLLGAGGLYLDYQRRADRLQSEYARVHAEKVSLQQGALEVAELAKIYGSKADIAAFTEALYGCARQAGIDDHEVITSLYREEAQARGGRGPKKGNSLQAHRLEVSAAGEFRKIAEYVAQLQSLDDHIRLTRLTLTPGERVLKAKIMIDLYSLGEAHAR